VEKIMENLEQIRILIGTLAPILVAVTTGIFLIYQQRLKEDSERNSPKIAEEVKKTNAETAKQITDAASEIITEYQEMIKELKAQYITQIEKIENEIKAVQQVNELLKASNADLQCKYDAVLKDNEQLRKELDELKLLISSK